MVKSVFFKMKRLLSHDALGIFGWTCFIAGNSFLAQSHVAVGNQGAALAACLKHCQCCRPTLCPTRTRPCVSFLSQTAHL